MEVVCSIAIFVLDSKVGDAEPAFLLKPSDDDGTSLSTNVSISSFKVSILRAHHLTRNCGSELLVAARLHQE